MIECADFSWGDYGKQSVIEICYSELYRKIRLDTFSRKSI